MTRGPALLALAICLSYSPLSLADWNFLPASRHPLFITYGLFTEEQTSVIIKDEDRAYLALGGSWTLLEQSTAWGQPQFLFSATVISSFGSSSERAFQYAAQSMDVRGQLAVEWTPARDWRFSVGAEHVSGHVLEGIPEKQLVAPDLGGDDLVLRYLHDFDARFRLGTTLRLFAQRSPDGKPVAADQFAEWFPWGADTPTARAVHAPYLAIGFEEDGYQTYYLSFHAQLGLLYGYHFQPEKQTSLRTVVGYYHGPDPRLKYFAYLQSQADFLYIGCIVNF